MDKEEIRKLIREEIIKSQVANTYAISSIPRHVHNGVDSPKVSFPDVNPQNNQYDMFNIVISENSIQFDLTDSQTFNYEIVYDDVSGYLMVRPTVAGAGGIEIGDAENSLKFAFAKVAAATVVLGDSTGVDEVDLQGTEVFAIATHVECQATNGNDFYFRLPNGNGNPSATITGALAVVSGKLKIYDGSNWVVVGTQT